MTKFYWFLADEQYQPEELVKQAKAVEAAGFDGIMISEHLQPWVDDKGTSGFTFSILGAIAAVTEKIKLITGVTTPLYRYHPAVMAQIAATLDRLSNGRFELGIGTGELLNEGPLGFNFPNYKERSDRIIEAMEIINRLLSGEKLDFDGTYYQTIGLKLYSPPLTKLQMYMAAGGPKSAITASKYCDGIITSVKNINDTINNVVNPASNDGDGIKRLIATRWSVFAENDDQAWEALSAQRGLRAPSRAVTIDPAILQSEADTLDRSDVLSKYSQIRKLTDYLEVYSPLVTDLKADTVTIQTTSLDQLGTITSFGREILPELRKL